MFWLERYELNKFIADTKIKLNDLYQALGIETKHMRNSQLLTVAPTGSISTMLGVSGGIEPIFANSYNRKTITLHKQEVYYKVPISQEFVTLLPNNLPVRMNNATAS